MSEPISLFHVRDHSRDLAFSALPEAPVRDRSHRRRPARAMASAVGRHTVQRFPLRPSERQRVDAAR